MEGLESRVLLNGEVLYSEGFERGIGSWEDWTTDHGVWEIGKAAGAHAGENMAGTILAGNYPGDTDSRLISPEFVLPTVSGEERVKLRFWQWYAYGGDDQGSVDVMVWDGSNWGQWQRLATPAVESTNSGDWAPGAVDLTAYARKRVKISFAHEADSYPYGSAAGWYIDDVTLWRGVSTLVNPEGFERGEGTWDDWTTDHGVWQIGRPTAGPGGAFTGENAAGTILAGNYPGDTDSRLISPEWVLPTVSGEERVKLRFWHWYSYGGDDQGSVDVMVWDGSSWGPWQRLATPVMESTNSGGWSPTAIDLTGYAGKRIKVSFAHEADSYPYGSAAGWYIDDVQITPRLAVAAVLNVPGTQLAQEDMDLAVSGVGLSYTDDGSGIVALTMSVSHGVLNVRSDVGGGLVAEGVEGNGTGSVRLTGSMAAVNATLGAADGLVYRGASDFNGEDTLRVASGGTSPKDVLIQVGAVNDAPAFTLGPDPMVSEDAEAQTVAAWATEMSAGPADEAGQGLSFIVSSDKPGLFAEGPAISADGELSFTPAANAYGVATVSVRVRDDGGTADGGVDTSEAQTFTIAIDAVNDAPADVLLSSTSVLEGRGVGTAVGTLGGVDPDGDDTLTFRLIERSDDPDNGAFVIEDGVLKSNMVFDYQAKNRYQIHVQAMDAEGLTYEREFTISVLRAAVVSGVAFNDLNGDGSRGAAEKALANQRMFLDLDRDGKLDAQEPQQRTDATGRYSFVNLAPGRYRVRIAAGKGWRVSGGISGHDLTLKVGSVVTRKDFGVTQLALATGAVFNDGNGNRARDKGEGGLAKWTVFADADKDGVLDKGEASALTKADGSFALNLRAGLFTLRVRVQGKYRSTAPAKGQFAGRLSAGQTLAGRLFGFRP